MVFGRYVVDSITELELKSVGDLLRDFDVIVRLHADFSVASAKGQLRIGEYHMGPLGRLCPDRLDACGCMLPHDLDLIGVAGNFWPGIKGIDIAGEGKSLFQKASESGLTAFMRLSKDGPYGKWKERDQDGNRSEDARDEGGVDHEASHEFVEFYVYEVTSNSIPER